MIQAPDDILNPEDGLNGVDVRASYKSMKPDLDTTGLNWLGTSGAGTSTDLELPGDASGSVIFRIPGSMIGANIERRVSVAYGVTC